MPIFGAWGRFSQSSVYKSWKQACDEAEVPFFNPYKLRHSYATALRAQGMDLADVQELMGHKSATTTRRFNVGTFQIVRKMMYISDKWLVPEARL
jgi:integrase